MDGVKLERKHAVLFLAIAVWNLLSYANFAKNLAETAAGGEDRPTGYYVAHIVLIVVNVRDRPRPRPARLAGLAGDLARPRRAEDAPAMTAPGAGRTTDLPRADVETRPRAGREGARTPHPHLARRRARRPGPGGAQPRAAPAHRLLQGPGGAQLRDGPRRGHRAVTAASGGNHGAAVAWAARRDGLRADVFVRPDHHAEKPGAVGLRRDPAPRRGARGGGARGVPGVQRVHGVPWCTRTTPWRRCGAGTVGL